MNTDTTNVKISTLIRNGGTQSRAQLDEATVQEYAALIKDAGSYVMSSFPPIEVVYDGADHYLSNGFHRVEAAQRSGELYIPAIVTQGDKRDAILASCQANTTHGLKRTDADKRRAVETLLRDDTWRQWSDRHIAKLTGTTHPFVGKIRKEMEDATGNVTSQRKYTHASGTETTMRVPAHKYKCDKCNTPEPEDRLILFGDMRLCDNCYAAGFDAAFKEHECNKRYVTVAAKTRCTAADKWIVRSSDELWKYYGDTSRAYCGLDDGIEEPGWLGDIDMDETPPYHIFEMQADAEIDNAQIPSLYQGVLKLMSGGQCSEPDEAPAPHTEVVHQFTPTSSLRVDAILKELGNFDTGTVTAILFKFFNERDEENYAKAIQAVFACEWGRSVSAYTDSQLLKAVERGDQYRGLWNGVCNELRQAREHLGFYRNRIDELEVMLETAESRGEVAEVTATLERAEQENARLKQELSEASDNTETSALRQKNYELQERLDVLSETFDNLIEDKKAAAQALGILLYALGGELADKQYPMYTASQLEAMTPELQRLAATLPQYREDMAHLYHLWQQSHECWNVSQVGNAVSDANEKDYASIIADQDKHIERLKEKLLSAPIMSAEKAIDLVCDAIAFCTGPDRFCGSAGYMAKALCWAYNPYAYTAPAPEATGFDEKRMRMFNAIVAMNWYGKRPHEVIEDGERYMTLIKKYHGLENPNAQVETKPEPDSLSMCSRDAHKLMNAGFNIIRSTGYTIRQATNRGGWQVIRSFKKKGDAKAYFDQMLQDEKTVSA